MNRGILHRLRIRRSVIAALAALASAPACAQEPPDAPPAAPQSTDERDEPTSTVACGRLPERERVECEHRSATREEGAARASENDGRERKDEHEAAAPPVSDAESGVDVARAPPPRATDSVRRATREPDEADDADTDLKEDDPGDEDPRRHEQRRESDSESDTLGPPDSG